MKITAENYLERYTICFGDVSVNPEMVAPIDMNGHRISFISLDRRRDEYLPVLDTDQRTCNAIAKAFQSNAHGTTDKIKFMETALGDKCRDDKLLDTVRQMQQSMINHKTAQINVDYAGYVRADDYDAVNLLRCIDGLRIEDCPPDLSNTDICKRYRITIKGDEPKTCNEKFAERDKIQAVLDWAEKNKGLVAAIYLGEVFAKAAHDSLIFFRDDDYNRYRLSRENGYIQIFRSSPIQRAAPGRGYSYDYLYVNTKMAALHMRGGNLVLRIPMEYMKQFFGKKRLKRQEHHRRACRKHSGA